MLGISCISKECLQISASNRRIWFFRETFIGRQLRNAINWLRWLLLESAINVLECDWMGRKRCPIWPIERFLCMVVFILFWLILPSGFRLLCCYYIIYYSFFIYVIFWVFKRQVIVMFILNWSSLCFNWRFSSNYWTFSIHISFISWLYLLV